MFGEARVEFCNICNATIADGKLTVIIEDTEQVLDACEGCVNDPEKVRFL